MKLISQPITQGVSSLVSGQVLKRSFDFTTEVLPAGISVTRGSAGYCMSEQGLILKGADSARFNTLEQPAHLLVEPQRTNMNPNSSFQGTAGELSFPDYWKVRVGENTTVSLEGQGEEFGMRYLDIRVQCTSFSTVTSFRPMAEALANALSGEKWVATFYARMIGGSKTNLIDIVHNVVQRTVEGVYLGEAGSPQDVRNIERLSENRERFEAGYTLSDPLAGAVEHYFWISGTPNEPYDITLRVSGLQLECGEQATSHIPTMGSPVTRAEETLNLYLPYQRNTLAVTFKEGEQQTLEGVPRRVSIPASLFNENNILKMEVTSS